MAIEIEPGAIYVRYERLAQVYPLGEAALLRGEGPVHDGQIARYAGLDPFMRQALHERLQAWGLQAGADFGDEQSEWLRLCPEGYPQGCAMLRQGPDGPVVHGRNFHDFLAGRLQPVLRRATLWLTAGPRVLLVRYRGQAHFVLPGTLLQPGETAAEAGQRLLKEQLQLASALPLSRRPVCDADGRRCQHLVLAAEYTAPWPTPAAAIEQTWLWQPNEEGPVAPHVSRVAYLRSMLDFDDNEDEASTLRPDFGCR